MDEKQKELLNRVIENRAEMALDPSLDAGEREQAYKEAMGAYDRATKVAELEASQKQAKENRILEWVRVGVVGVAVPVTLLVVKEISKWKFGRRVMEFEKNDSFTTTPGKSSMSSFFRD